MNDPIKLGIVGIGKIARDRHLPAIAAEPAFALTALASRHAVDCKSIRYATIDEMLLAVPALEAVSICTPPLDRHLLAAKAFRADKHVMIEKPPGATVSEVIALTGLAKACRKTLFATWHSREAAGVAAAREWLQDKTVRSARVTWKEDVRVWHPGQDWIFAAGGLGVFDPGINALSIITTIFPGSMLLDTATLSFPVNRHAPIAASLRMSHDDSAIIEVELDFLQTGPPCWNIEVETDAGQMRLTDGGARLWIDGGEVSNEADQEYSRLYRRFAKLIEAEKSDVDLQPLQLVADAFLLGERCVADVFEF